jgi:hypothetical protein
MQQNPTKDEFKMTEKNQEAGKMVEQNRVIYLLFAFIVENLNV